MTEKYIPSVFEAHAIKALTATIADPAISATTRRLAHRALDAAKALTESRAAAVREALEHV